MSYHLGAVAPDERAAGAGDPPGGRVRLLVRAIASSALVLLVMAAFAGGVWFAHFAGRRHAGAAGVPLIRADSRPMKVRPAAPGGMVVPDQHMLVYGERHDQVEHLLPPPEAPMPRPALPPPPPAPKPPAALVPAAAAPPVPAPAPAPAKVPPAPILAKAPPATPATSAKPAPAPLRPAIARTGGVRLQLGSVRTPEAARREWQHLKEVDADLLGNIDGFAMRVDLGAKGVYYRIETAPLAEPAVAAKICGELKRRGAGCVLDR